MDRNDILQRIAAEVGRGDVSFPTSARIALKLQRALDDPDCHMELAARLIKAEPMIAAKVVALANSAAYNRSGREITDVATAASRLGFRTIRTLASAVVTRQLAGAPSGEHAQLAARLWEHTAHVAALAHVLARRVTKLDAETAFFAGVVHEIGGFYLISRAKDFPGLLDEGMQEWAETGMADVGRAVLRVLAVPQPVVDAIEVFWQGYLALPPASLGDTLLLAEELSPVPCPLIRAPLARDEGMAAQIDMLVGEDALTAILQESADDVASLTNALRV